MEEARKENIKTDTGKKKKDNKGNKRIGSYKRKAENEKKQRRRKPMN